MLRNSEHRPCFRMTGPFRNSLGRRPFLGAPSRLSSDRTGGSVISTLGGKDSYDVGGTKSDGHGGAESSCQKHGGGGAHAYRIARSPGDLFPDNNINYHFLLVEIEHGKLNVTMNRLQLKNGKAGWTKPDMARISVAAIPHATAAPVN